MMLPWKTCGTPVPNSILPVPCVRKMDESLRMQTTKLARMIKHTALSSSVPLKCFSTISFRFRFDTIQYHVICLHETLDMY